MKRKLDEHEDTRKRLKMTDGSGSETSNAQATTSNPLPLELEVDIKSKGKKKKEPKDSSRRRINKLVPPRPFPIVPTSVSATGPRSNHKEGKNLICITRKTSLACYLRRCKDIIIKDGYKTLHLSAMGAAIPHLLKLTCALPPILPFPQDEIHHTVTTGTVEVQDEVLPEDDEDDMTYETRGKSTLLVVLKIGDGIFEGDKTGSRKYAGGKGGKVPDPQRNGGKKGKAKEIPSEIVIEEPEQEYMDML